MLAEKVQKNNKSISQLSQVIAQKPLSPSTIPLSRIEKGTGGKKPTYAQVVGNPTTPPKEPSSTSQFTTVSRKKTARKITKEDLQNRQLILITNKEQQNQEINPLSLRNQINKAFQTISQKPVIATIYSSRLKRNIVLTTTEHYNAEFLSQHEEKWKHLFQFTRQQKAESWAQIVVHGVPLVEPFLGSNGAITLK